MRAPLSREAPGESSREEAALRTSLPHDRRTSRKDRAAAAARPVHHLDDAERITLEWPGRQWRPRTPLTGAVPSFFPLEITRLIDHETARDCLIWGNAKDVAQGLLGEGLEGLVDLVYIDPPFASQTDYIHEARLDGMADGRVVRTHAYTDQWTRGGIGTYLDALAPPLEQLSRLLGPRGTMWVHLDWRASYLVRVLLDEIFGRDAFLNEIVWRRAPNLGRQAASNQFGRTLDTILVYGNAEATLVPPTRLEPIEPKAIRKDDEGRLFTSAPRGDYTDESIARLEKEGRVHRTASGRVYIKYFLVPNSDGVWCRERRVDTLWTDVAPLRHAAASERTGFPTQKPRALLERIIQAATRPGELVVDLFAGSGTTGEAAHATGRRFILGDAGPVAFATARARLLRAGATLSLEQCSEGELPQGPRLEARARRAWGGEVEVELVSPEEPAAWAVDPDHDPSFGVSPHLARRAQPREEARSGGARRPRAFIAGSEDRRSGLR